MTHTADTPMHGNPPDAECTVGATDAPAAHCALWWRHVPTLPGRRLGLIGRYAAAGTQEAAELLHTACEQLRAEGCTHAVGPMDGSTWHDYRLVSWRGSEPRFLLEPDPPDAGPRQFEAAGFGVLANYWSSRCDDLGAYPLHATLDARLRTHGFSERALDMHRLDDEIELLWRLASDAFAGNFLYTPISLAEFRRLHDPLVPLVRPAFVRFAEQQGHAVGFVLAVPDLLQPARGEPLDTLVVKTLGVVSARAGLGLGTWLVDCVITQARAAGLRRAIFALMHEDNPSRRVGRGMMHDFRRYSLYQRAL